MRCKAGSATRGLLLPRQYEEVHANPDSDCYLLQVTTLNFIFTSIVMGMTLSLVSTPLTHPGFYSVKTLSIHEVALLKVT